VANTRPDGATRCSRERSSSPPSPPCEIQYPGTITLARSSKASATIRRSSLLPDDAATCCSPCCATAPSTNRNPPPMLDESHRGTPRVRVGVGDAARGSAGVGTCVLAGDRNFVANHCRRHERERETVHGRLPPIRPLGPCYFVGGIQEYNGHWNPSAESIAGSSSGATSERFGVTRAKPAGHIAGLCLCIGRPITARPSLAQELLLLPLYNPRFHLRRLPLCRVNSRAYARTYAAFKRRS
jgi:hypothetical protein